MSLDLFVAEVQGREVPPGRASTAELTPAQVYLRQMVLESATSAHSRRNYSKALDLLFDLAAVGRSPGLC